MNKMTSTPKDVNNKHSNNIVLGKRKRVREKRSNYLQKWLEKSMQCTLGSIPDVEPNDTLNSINANYWSAHAQGMYGQRLFPAASDPSVFRYSNPYSYSQEPLSLPLYTPPVYPPSLPTLFPNFLPQYPTQLPLKSSQRRPQYNNVKKNSNRKHIQESESNQMPNGSGKSKSNASSLIGTNNEFASLPPAINHFPEHLANLYQEEPSSGNKRRFSDPGIGQNQSLEASNDESLDESDGESSVCGGSQADNKLVMCLVDQISALKETNRKLYKELHETRAELDGLKQQTSMWRPESLPRQSPQSSHLGVPSGAGLANSSTMYTPGMLSDLVREIRDAARIREEALYSKVKSLLDERQAVNKMNGNIQVDKNVSDWRHLEHNYKNQLHVNGMEKSRNYDVINRLEEELQKLRLQQSREEAANSLSYSGSCTSPMSLPHQYNPDIDRSRLRAELVKEKTAREAADAHVHKLELMVTQLSKRNHHSNNHTPTHANSSMGASQSDGLHMVLGPVTDL